MDSRVRPLSDRAFGLSFAALFGVIGAVGLIFFGAWPRWALFISSALLAAALVLPRALLPLNRAWQGLAVRLGWLNTRLVLGLFYFGILWPVAAIFRLVGRDTMQRKIDTRSTTYWSVVARHQNAETLHDMF